MKLAGKLSKSRIYICFCNKSFLIGLLVSLSTMTYGETESLYKVDSVEQSYVLRRGDVIDILVMEHPEFSVPSTVVLPDGTVQFPGLGSIPAAGLSIKDFTRVMNINVEKYVVNPIVSIFIRSLPTQMVNVVGYVTRPGQVAIFEPVDLITLLSRAGGITNIKKCKYITIVRANQSFQVIKVKDLFNMRSTPQIVPKLNVGDTVYVVEPKEFNWSKLTFFTSLGYITLSVITLLINKGVI
jgi:polysaccharide biosynthesis/export protein